MKRTTLKIFLGAFLVLALASCRSAPVFNVETASHNASANATVAQVGDAIKRAGARLGWVMKDVGPGHFEGRLALRSHLAVTDITFDTKTFSIAYKDSVNLNYDPGKNIIHTNYNGWIQNLQNAILAETTGI